MSAGPELRGSNITLEVIEAPTNVSTRHTKIICTLGPACWEVHQLERLIDAGMSVARFNFSHGDHEGHKACLDRLRTAASNRGAHVGTSPPNPRCSVARPSVGRYIADAASRRVPVVDGKGNDGIAEMGEGGRLLIVSDRPPPTLPISPSGDSK